MANELTTFMSNAQLPAANDLADALTTTVNQAGGVSQAGLNFLGFSGKTGVYSLGKNKDDVEDDQFFIVEPVATIAGWTCWVESKPVGKHKWLSVDAFRRPELIVHESDLEDHGPYRANSGDGWKEMMGIGLMDLSDMATSIEFSSTAVSAINGLKDIIQEAANRLRDGEPEMPIVWLGREQFTAQGATNWKPTFNVEVWVTRKAVGAFVSGKMSESDLLAAKAPRKKRGNGKAKK